MSPRGGPPPPPPPPPPPGGGRGGRPRPGRGAGGHGRRSEGNSEAARPGTNALREASRRRVGNEDRGDFFTGSESARRNQTPGAPRGGGGGGGGEVSTETLPGKDGSVQTVGEKHHVVRRRKFAGKQGNLRAHEAIGS